MEEARDLEQEAETALLSIGAMLEWKVKAASFLWLQARLDTEPVYQEYDLQFHPSYSPQACVKVFCRLPNGAWDWKKTKPNKDDLMPLYWYPSVAEAKAACEVHAVTGQFPPSVEPILPRSE